MNISFEELSPTLHQHITDNPISGHLYHYTGAAGLIGILQYKKFWMSHVNHLNDSQEIKHFISIVKEIVSEEGFSRMQSNSSFTNSNDYFIGSFSEAGDLLSQWRAYCPEVGGFSIGIPAIHLLNLVLEENNKVGYMAKDQTKPAISRLREKYLKMPLSILENEFLLVKCIYSLDDQRKIANEILANSHSGIDLIHRISPIFKHPSFAEEKEWRIIPPRTSIREFRDSPRGLTMYREFSLSTEENPLKEAKTEQGIYTTVTCGPTANKDGIKQAVYDLFTRCDLFRIIGDEVYVRESTIPYRTW